MLGATRIAMIVGTSALALSCIAHGASLDVVVEELDSEAAACGVTKSQLVDLARLTLRNNRVQPSTVEGGVAYLYVRVAVVHRSGVGCMGSLDIQIKTIAEPLIKTGFRNPKGYPMAVLCDEGGLVVAPRAVYSSQLEQEMESFIKQCLGSLDY